MEIVKAIESGLLATKGSIATYDEGELRLIVETRNTSVSICLTKLQGNVRHHILYYTIDGYSDYKYADIFAWYFYCKALEEKIQLSFTGENTAFNSLRKAFEKAKHISWVDGERKLELAFGNSEYLYLNVDLLVFYRDIVKDYKDTFEKDWLKPIESTMDFASRLASISEVHAVCEEQLDTKLRIKYKRLLEEFIECTEHEALHKCWHQLNANEQACREQIVAGFKKAEPTFDDTDVAECIAYIATKVDADLAVNEGLVTLAEVMYNWQAINQVSFDLATLAEILYANLVRLAEEEPVELSLDSDIQSALDLLKSQHWSEILDIAYIAPLFLMK